MKPAVVLLGLILLLDITFAAEESCVNRCGSFDLRRKCQCDSMCLYYSSCCDDFNTVCPKKIARGDTFEELHDLSTTQTPPQTPAYDVVAAMTSAPPPLPPATSSGPPSAPEDPDAVTCSGRPFDAFLQLKNGSIYAFRGIYFFELDDKAVLPGYPKLIEDVWGIPGPIDAAFTRINCQGKSYIFKGNKYWRFDGDVMDEDYPRDISVGFEGVPDDINAAFAVPAPSHLGKEKAHFFKGDKYYQYEFKHQPTHEECVQMSRSSPSLLFTRYTDLFCDQTLENFFTELFGDSFGVRDTGPRLISRDWVGVRPNIDAAMVGRVYLSPKPTQPPPRPAKKRSRRKKKPKNRRQRARQSQPFIEDLWSDLFNPFDYRHYDDYFDYDYSEATAAETPAQKQRATPVQNVFFFKRDKYYRVDLQTKRVDSANPPYPRSIAKYWLGCKHEETVDALGAEKR